MVPPGSLLAQPAAAPTITRTMRPTFRRFMTPIFLGEHRGDHSGARSLAEIDGRGAFVADGRGDQRVEQLVVGHLAGVEELTRLEEPAAVPPDDVGHVHAAVARPVRDV